MRTTLAWVIGVGGWIASVAVAVKAQQVLWTTGLLQCRLGSHDWKTHQVVIHTEPAGAETNGRDVLLAWGQCKRCAHSKLIHILK